MKIAITSQGMNLDDPVDSRFGRCAYFLISKENDETSESIKNEPGASGAGVEAAQKLANAGVEAVITGNLGPKASRALRTAGIKAFYFSGGSGREAILAFREGKLNELYN